MDIASVVGILGAFALCIYGIAGQKGLGALEAFYDQDSVFITFGGALCTVLMMQGSVKDFLNNLKSITLIMKPISVNEEETIRSIISLSTVARKEGLLALEEASNTIEDLFLRKGIMLIVDGTDPELVRSIMETELNCIEGRHSSVVGFWGDLGAMGPAWGMIGTLIGLINMLGELQDVASVGPNMAVALVTTFYGSMLANWICAPVANKLKSNSASEIMSKEIMVEGLLSIQAGENPRVIEEKLKSFLSPKKRDVLAPEGGEANG